MIEDANNNDGHANSGGDGPRHSFRKHSEPPSQYSQGPPPKRKRKKRWRVEPSDSSGQTLKSRARSGGNRLEQHKMPEPRNFFEIIIDGGFTKLIKINDLTEEFVSQFSSWLFL
jgi:hypothetical protein